MVSSATLNNIRGVRGQLYGLKLKEKAVKIFAPENFAKTKTKTKKQKQTKNKQTKNKTKQGNQMKTGTLTTL